MIAAAAKANGQARVLCGRDDHHQAEALVRALDAATQIDRRPEGDVPSATGAV